MPQFLAAAQRHHADALFLLNDGRHENADQLAGYAAECALKALLCSTAGGVAVPASGPPRTPTGKSLGHFPKLLDEAVAHLSGRLAGGASQTLSLLAPTPGQKPFSAWSIDDRYDAGRITAPSATDHLGLARQVLRLAEHEALTGVIL